MKSGQAPFTFSYSEDLRTLPESALSQEEKLHGGFAVDKRPGQGEVFYGMPGHGLMKVKADLTSQETIELPSDLKPLNLHSTKIGMFDGKTRLFVAANEDARVAVLTLEGELEYLFEVPEFDVYRSEGVAFKPTDTSLVGNELFVADGYGRNYISVADLNAQKWTRFFAGKTTDPNELGKFGTAHGMNRSPGGKTLAIADRPHSRVEIADHHGDIRVSHALPDGSTPCGIDFAEIDGAWYAAVGSLNDPQEGRAAPIYILDAETYHVVSTIRPKEELGVPLADHMHNVVWHQRDGETHLVCQAWNPGYYFVLNME